MRAHIDQSCDMITLLCRKASKWISQDTCASSLTICPDFGCLHDVEVIL